MYTYNVMFEKRDHTNVLHITIESEVKLSLDEIIDRVEAGNHDLSNKNLSQITGGGACYQFLNHHDGAY